jgi:hypothetical protein
MFLARKTHLHRRETVLSELLRIGPAITCQFPLLEMIAELRNRNDARAMLTSQWTFSKRTAMAERAAVSRG